MPLSGPSMGSRHCRRNRTPAMRGLTTQAMIFGFGIVVFLLVGGCSEGDNDKIQNNLDAERLVKVGMTLQEVGDLIDTPRPPWTSLELVDAPQGDLAYIFFPRITASSRPAWVFFSKNQVVTYDSATVVSIARFSCQDTIELLVLGGQHTGVPQGSACKP